MLKDHTPLGEEGIPAEFPGWSSCSQQWVSSCCSWLTPDITLHAPQGKRHRVQRMRLSYSAPLSMRDVLRLCTGHGSIMRSRCSRKGLLQWSSPPEERRKTPISAKAAWGGTILSGAVSPRRI